MTLLLLFGGAGQAASPFEAIPPFATLKLSNGVESLYLYRGAPTLKLPDNVQTLHLPALQSMSLTTSLSGSTRITEALHTRVTRGGHTRVTRDYTIDSRPELAVVKLDNGVIHIPVAAEGKTKARRK